MTEEKKGRPPVDEWSEYGTTTECYVCHGSTWYRVYDFTFQTHPVRRYFCQECFRRWTDEMRPGEGGQYPFTFRPLYELRHDSILEKMR